MNRSCFFLILLGVAFGLAKAGDEPQPRPAPSVVAVDVDGGRLTLEALVDNAVRVRFSRDDKPAEASRVLVEKGSAAFQVRETGIGLVLTLPRLQVTFDRKTGALAFFDGEGRPLLREIAGSRRVEAGQVAGEPTWSVSQQFDSPPEERLFGLGQFQDGVLNVRGLPRRLTQVNTQISIPFIVSSRGFGLLWHNYGLTEFDPADQVVPLAASENVDGGTAVDVTSTEGTRREVRHSGVFEGRFKIDAAGQQAFFLDVGQKMARRWHVEIDGRATVDFANVWLPPTTGWISELGAGEHTVRVVGVKEDRPSLRFRPARDVTEFRSPVAEALDYVVIAGRGDVVTATYRRLTGPAPLLPRWALGYVHCRERYKSQEELLANAAEFRTRSIPIDVIVQDWQYWGRHGWNAMRFDEASYPDPGAMVRTLHDEHIRLMLSVWSKIDPKSEVGRVAQERNYFIPGTDWVDFFNPEAAAFYWENFRTRLVPLGIDAWWLDATEPENDDLQGRRTHPGPGERFRNIYPLLVAQTVYEGLRKDRPDQRVCILTRCAFAGQQRYGTITWSGDVGSDWESLRRQVVAGLGYAAAGMPWWTTDAGGFFRPGPDQYSNEDYKERLLRWLQFSVFSPLMRVHGYQTDTEPWRYGAAFEKEARRWIELRYRLLPYIYSEAARVSLDGSTLMRPLVFDFPDDVQALDQTTEYLFGPALLVAPVVQPGTSLSVYLPRNPGGWYDFWTGEHFDGGRTVTRHCGLDTLPVYVRAGSILPLGPTVQYANEQPDGPYEIRLYPGADGRFTLYEDDNETYACERGERATYDLVWDDAKRTLHLGGRQGRFAGLVSKRELKIVVTGSPAESGRSVTYAGEPIDLTIGTK